MAPAPALLINIGGTRAALDFYSFFTPISDITSECNRCAGLTRRPSEHLEWHISIGDNPLAEPTGEPDGN
jgi:hypothetical protein